MKTARYSIRTDLFSLWWPLVSVLALAAGTAPFGAEPVLTEQAAIQRAACYIGFGGSDLGRATVTVERVVPEGDKTPFLSNLVNGRDCYRVRFSGVNINLPWGERDHRVAPFHELNALLDARSGKLLRVWSTKWLDPPTAKRTAAEVEAKYRRFCSERWAGVPDALPTVPLLKALYNPFESHTEQLDAYYVTRVTEGWNGPETVTRPAWELVTYSQTSFSSGQGPEQDTPYPIYGWRIVVDAETGEMLDSSNWY
jgi:hypothetical protein